MGQTAIFCYLMLVTESENGSEQAADADLPQRQPGRMNGPAEITTEERFEMR